MRCPETDDDSVALRRIKAPYSKPNKTRSSRLNHTTKSVIVSAIAGSVVVAIDTADDPCIDEPAAR